MTKDTEVLLSQETFLAELAMGQTRTALDAANVARLYALASEYLVNRGAGLAVDASRGRPGELPYKIPGMPIHVRLSAPTREELKDFLSCGMMLLGMAKGDPAAITVGVVLTLMSRVRLLKAPFGERCVVAAVLESPRPVERNVCEVLYAKQCRRPTVKCRFHDGENNVCLLGLKDITRVLQGLRDKNVLELITAVDPPEYSVVT
jgi:hypothetical protein